MIIAEAFFTGNWKRLRSEWKMQRCIGAMLIIIATTGWGMCQAWKIEECYRQMRYLRKLIFRLRSELQYSRQMLPEAVLLTGKDAQEPYQSWLLSLYERLRNRQGTSLSVIWQEEVKEYLTDVELPEEIVESLGRIGSELGTIDLQMQIRTLDLYMESMEQRMEELHAEEKERIRLHRCIGITAGIFLSIILL